MTVPEEFPDRTVVIPLAARVVSSAVALTPRLGMRRATDVRLEFLDLMEAVDEVDTALEDSESTGLDSDDRTAAEALAQRLYPVAELIDSQARSFPRDPTHGQLERIAFRVHDLARRLHHLSLT
jgi:hypothetical protein